MFGFKMGRVQPQVHLFGEAPRRLFQGQDFLRKDLRPLVAGVDLANHKDGLAGRQQVAILIVVLVHAKHLHRAFQVFERDHRVGFAALF